MSHHLENKRSAFARPAWHGLGEIIDPSTTRDVRAFQDAARMRYTVTKEPVYVVDDSGYTVVPNQWHLMRSDDQRIVSGSTVSDRYTPLQPGVLFDVAEPFVREGWGSPDAAFTLYGGQSEVVTLRLDLQDSIPGDPSAWAHYLVLQNHHGKGAVRGKKVSVRVVCHNTATIAFRGGADFAIRHSAKVEDNVRTAVSTWKEIREELQEMSKRLAPLTQKVLGLHQTGKVLHEILGTDPEKPNRAYQQILEAAFDSPGVSGNWTAYDLLQGVTFFNSHGGNKSKQENRVAALVNGPKAALEKRATEKLLALV